MINRSKLWLACLILVGLAAPADGGPEIKYIEPNKDTGTSMAVIVDDAPLLHTAQLLPLDRGGEIVGKGDAAAQIEKVLDNLVAVLDGAPGRPSLDRAVKINVYATGPEVVAQV